MNTRFIVRGSLLAVSAVLTAFGVMWLARSGWLEPPPLVPPSPTIDAPAGELPTGPIGLAAYAQFERGRYVVGCGFLMGLADGQIVGVTTAHSVAFDEATGLVGIALGTVPEFDTLRGEPGQPRQGEDMTVDVVLLQPARDAEIDPALILTPDRRGRPQPGERLVVYAPGSDGPRRLSGVVQSSHDLAVWVVMDEVFDPSGLSGSPVISAHTGHLVGMVIAATRRGQAVLLGLNPSGALVRRAEAATTFPRIADYRR